LRAIYNKAVDERLVSDHHPFEACFTGKMKTDKRSINEQCIITLKNADLRMHKELIMTRDLFLFSFYTMGMPFVDIAYLKKTQIKDNLLVYRRHKTHQMVKIPLCSDALHIINIYSTQTSEYVFPLLSSLNEAKSYQEYCTRLNAYNRSLKRLAKETGIDIGLTSYTMRHSWASLAYKSGVPLPVISQALGHTRPDTTMVYIRALDNDQMQEGNIKVQRLINGK
jgi:integrase